MTEATTTPQARSGAPLCRAGSKTEHPCWRPAVKPGFSDEAELSRCAEHFKVRQLADDLDGWLFARETLRAFMEGPVQDDPTGDLTRLCYHWYAEVTREAARAAHKFQVAKHIAARGPEDVELGPESRIVCERLAHLLNRADEFTTARAILGGESGYSEGMQLAALDALEEAAQGVNEEFDKFRAEHIRD